MAKYKTIKVKKYSDVIEEFVVAEEKTIAPGMVVKLTANGEVEPGGSALLMVALEDELQGKGIDDAYVAGDPVQVWIHYRGDIFNGIGSGLTVGTFVEADTDGKLVTHSTGVVVGQVVEVLENNRVLIRVA